MLNNKAVEYGKSGINQAAMTHMVCSKQLLKIHKLSGCVEHGSI